MTFPRKCDRCGVSFAAGMVHTMSRFNEDEICLLCQDDETQAPGYQAAYDAELASVKKGDRNFPGVGLSPEDQAFLAKRREERKKQERKKQL